MMKPIRLALLSLAFIGLADARATPVYQLNSGGTYNPSTDKVLTVRNGGGVNNPEVLTGLAASAATDTTNATNITSGTLAPARLPTPTSGSLGGVQSAATVSHQFLTGISTSGVPTQAQPSAADISGLAPSATTDTTDAANIGSGTLPAARLPNPSAATLGGTESVATVTHNFLTGISTLGVPSLAQPAFADLSGSIATGQMNSGTGASSTTYWRGDGTWATPAGGGSSTTPVTAVSCATSQALAFPASGNAAYDVTLTGNCAFTITGGTAGQYQTVTLVLRQDSTAGRSPTLPTGVKWPGGTSPVPNTAAGRIDVFKFSTPDAGTTVIGAY